MILSGCSATALIAAINQQLPRSPWAISSGVTPLGPHKVLSGHLSLALSQYMSADYAATMDLASKGTSSQTIASDVLKYSSVNLVVVPACNH